VIYLDHHATTPVDPRVMKAMLPFFSEKFGNPSSRTHRPGWDASDAVERARKQVAALIGASAREVVFTSGATEANNLAIAGVAAAAPADRRHIVTVATEHKAVLDPCRALEAQGWQVTVLPVAATGLVDLAAVEQAVTPGTALVSVMLANNEIGIVQPVAEIARLAHAHGAIVHTDAVQALGKLPIEVSSLDVDLASFSAHKLYGPKGVGALYVKRGADKRLRAQVRGGGQERGLRGGTLNVPGIVGLAAALRLCLEEMPAEAERLRRLRDRLFAGLCERVGNIALNGPALNRADLRLSGNLNCNFADVDGEALMLSMRHLAVSSGSACTSADPEPSHVLRALGLGDDLTRASLRFGLGRFNTAEEIEFAIETVGAAVERLRKLRGDSM